MSPVNGPGRRGRILLFALLLVAAYALPRAVALRGVQMSAYLGFMDMYYHLSNLDLLDKVRLLEPRQRRTYAARFPHIFAPLNKLRWPLGVHRVASLWARPLGPQSLWTTQLTNLLFSLVLVAGVVGLGTIMGGLRVGLWGALLTLLCPPLVIHTWYFSLDYPLAAMLLCGLCLLWWTRGFTAPGPTAALALWSTLAMAVKLSYVLYLAAPAVGALWVGLRGPRRWRALGTAALAAAAVLGLSFWVHGWTAAQLWGELRFHFTGEESPGLAQDFPFQLMEPLSLRWLISQALFATKCFPWPLLLLALPGVALAHTRRAPGGRSLVLCTLWAAVVLLTLMVNKMERYLHPVYPLLCLLTVHGVITLVPRRWATAALACLAAAYGATLWGVSRHPTPWLMGPEQASREGYMYELTMPEREVLDGLRRNTYHPACALRPLLGAAGELLALDGEQRLAALSLQGGGEDGLTLPTPQVTLNQLHLSLDQWVRDRVVLCVSRDTVQSDPELVAALPSLLVVHEPGQDPARGYPGRFAPVARREVTVRCAEAPPQRLGLTLLRQPGLAP